ncbi:hypothetical protein VTJ49DRAFT_5120 [Mycothermus thermophilus]|uniref:Uncharacterized protein n=1 Tax=Humicola insolens TaxID=85995 RepID=A0ABR3VKU6_HUMIN
MSFGDAIRALLDTYANCISRLKAFKGGGNGSGAAPSHNDPSRLRKSLRRDRSLIEQTYSSRLSESGSRLNKGDARAVRALDRVLKRLRNAIANVLRLSTKGDGVDLDYNSLMALSNASRIDAIRTIDSLSHQVKERRFFGGLFSRRRE